MIHKRKKGFAMIWLNNEVYTVFGDESILLQNEIAISLSFLTFWIILIFSSILESSKLSNLNKYSSFLKQVSSNSTGPLIHEYFLICSSIKSSTFSPFFLFKAILSKSNGSSLYERIS